MLTIVRDWRKTLISILLCGLLLVTGCAKVPSPYAQVQKETTGRGAPAAVAKTAEQGATFNKFFPDGVEGYEIVPSQEKKGFAEYKVLRDGKAVAMLSISDTSGLPVAAAKYASSTFQVANYPAIDQGTTTTGILVNNRYQVKVLSRDPAFNRDDRIAWLQKFDLAKLAKLEPAPAPTAKLPTPSTVETPVLPPQEPTLAPQEPILAPQEPTLAPQEPTLAPQPAA